MGCPICGTTESAAAAAGIRAGALVLVLVTALVGAAIARFAWRLWSLRVAGAPEDGDSRSLRAGPPHD